MFLLIYNNFNDLFTIKFKSKIMFFKLNNEKKFYIKLNILAKKNNYLINNTNKYYHKFNINTKNLNVRTTFPLNSIIFGR